RGRPPGALPWRHAGLLGVFALWGATLAPLRGRWRARLSCLPSAQLFPCPARGGSRCSLAPSAWGAAWFVLAAAPQAPALEPGLLSAAHRRATRNRTDDCRNAPWYGGGTGTQKRSPPWTKMTATIRCWKSG